MKIITWNCQGAFRKKVGAVLKHKPDILIIPECEHPDKLKFDTDIAQPRDLVWYGANLHKGLGVFSYHNYRFKLLDVHQPDYKTILPIEVTGGSLDFILLAVWANHPLDPDGAYVAQLWKAIHHYDDLLKCKHIVIAGDFNSNTIWDRPRRKGNHTHVVDYLANHEIYSTYHHFHQQLQGKEKHPTFYLHRNKTKSYHLDYCFASKDLLSSLSEVKIGTFNQWITFSDHMPLTIHFHI